MTNRLPYNFGTGRLFPDPFTLCDEANANVAYTFRNGPIENLHAGEYSELLDNPSLSRIKNSEMKTLVVATCEKMEELLRLKEANAAEYVRFILTYNANYCGKWDR